ncbi:hypothetical protein BHM03_00010491 [Ensete ventricosum]|nr:hypothetical protein BHM03_00010491 [Ensete ventricosum]
MGGGGASAETANPKPSPLNPNWAQLQQTLKSRGPPKPSHSADPGARTLAPSVLGKRKERAEPAPEASPSDFLSPTSTDSSLTDALAMDCEMVGVSIEGSKSAVGRVTLVLNLYSLLSIEDARAAMFIYNKYKKVWEKSMKKNFKFKEKLNKRKKKWMKARKIDLPMTI